MPIQDNLKSFFIGTKSEPFNLVLDNMNLENVINYEILSNELIDPAGLNINKLKNNDELKYLIVEDFRHLLVSKLFISSNFIEAGPYMKSLLSENWILESSFSSNNYSNIHIFSR